MALHLLPTTVVGSYPQPDWLVDRERLKTMVPRVRAPEIWRVPEPWLEQAQDDASCSRSARWSGPGIDIVTDGEIRRESYSNRFATALEGVDLANPGDHHRARGGRQVVPRIIGPIRRTRAGRDPRHQFLRRQHRADDQGHPARPLYHVAPGEERVLRRRGGARHGLRRRGQRRGERPRRRAPTSSSSTSPGSRPTRGRHALRA